MECSKCGAVLKDGAQFCTECGAKVEDCESCQTEELVKKEDSGATEEPVKAADSGEKEEFVKREETAKPKKKWKIIALIVLCVLLTGLVAVVINYKACVNFFMQSTKSPAQYMAYVLKNTVNEMTGNVGEKYGLLNENLVKKDELAPKASIKLDLGDSGRSMLNMLSVTMGYDTTWLNSLEVDMDSKADDKKAGFNLSTKVNDVDIASSELILDSENGVLYFAFPELSSKYIAFDERDLDLDFTKLNMLSTKEMQLVKDAIKASPDQTLMTKLLRKYVGLALDSMDGGKIKKGYALSVDNISQKCAKVTINLDDEILSPMVKAIAKEAAIDSDVKLWVKCMYNALDVNGYLDDVNLSGYTEDTAYERFVGQMNKLSDGGVATGIDGVKFSVYADRKGIIRGFELEGGDDLFSVLYPHRGRDFNCKIVYDSHGTQVALVGAGEDKSQRIDGMFTLKVKENKLLTFDLFGFDMRQLKKGYLNGDIKLRPAKGLTPVLANAIGINYASMISDMSFEIKMSNNKKKAYYKVSAMEDNDLLASVSIDASLDSGLKIKLPKESKTIKDGDALEQYKNGLKYDKLYKSFTKAGIPSEYNKYIEKLEDMDSDELLKWIYSGF